MSRQEGLSRIWRNGWTRLQNTFKEANLSMRCFFAEISDENSHAESHVFFEEKTSAIIWIAVTK